MVYLLHVNAEIKQLQFSFHIALNNCVSFILTNLVAKDSANITQNLINISADSGMKWKDRKQPPFMFPHILAE